LLEKKIEVLEEHKEEERKQALKRAGTRKGFTGGNVTRVRRRRRRNPSFTIRGRTRFFSLSAWNKEKQRRREQQACFSSVSRLKKQKLQRYTCLTSP
jgi:hypothetical protein